MAHAPPPGDSSRSWSERQPDSSSPDSTTPEQERADGKRTPDGDGRLPHRISWFTPPPPVARGALHIQPEHSHFVSPNWGACCLGEVGIGTSCQTDCEAQGGTFAGDLTFCDPNPCPLELTDDGCTPQQGESGQLYCIYDVANVQGGDCSGIAGTEGVLCILCDQNWPGGDCPEFDGIKWRHFDCNDNVTCAGDYMGYAEGGGIACTACPEEDSKTASKRQ